MNKNDTSLTIQGPLKCLCARPQIIYIIYLTKLIFFHKIFLKKFDMLKNDELITTFLKKRKIYTLLWNSSWIRNDMVIKFRQSYQFFRMLYITFFLSQKYFIVSTSLKVSIFFLHWVSRLILSERKGFFLLLSTFSEIKSSFTSISKNVVIELTK